MYRCTRWICVAVASVGLYPAAAGAQDTPAAKATRELIKKVTVTEEWKDAMTRLIFSDIAREADGKLVFNIDNTSGMSNNTRMSYTAKKTPIETILNDLADKNDFGWYVVSDKKDKKKDGSIMLRKSKFKERGYYEGKEPKASLPIERFYAYNTPTVTAVAVQGLRGAGVFIREE